MKALYFHGIDDNFDSIIPQEGFSKDDPVSEFEDSPITHVETEEGHTTIYTGDGVKGWYFTLTEADVQKILNRTFIGDDPEVL